MTAKLTGCHTWRVAKRGAYFTKENLCLSALVLLFHLSTSQRRVCQCALHLLTPTHVVYIMIGGACTLLRSPASPSSWHGSAGDVQEGNENVTFFIKAGAGEFLNAVYTAFTGRTSSVINTVGLGR